MRLKKTIFLVLLVIVHLVSGAQTISVAEDYLYTGDFRNAIISYTTLINGKDTLQPVDRGNCFLRRGHCLSQLKRADSALHDFFDALRIFEKLNNKERLAAATNNIGHVFFIKDDIANAASYYKQSFDLYTTIKDTGNIIKAMNNIAITEMQNKNIENAIALHKNAIALFPNKILLPVFTTHLQNIANCYTGINSDSALHYNNIALVNAKANADSPVIASIYNNLGFLYLNKKKFGEALNLLLQSEAIYNVYPDSTEQAVVYDNIAAVYDSMGQYKKAYAYLTMANLFNEIKLNTDKIRISTELAEKYESGKKDEEIASQQKQNKLKGRNIKLSMLALLLVALLGTVSFISYKRKQKANLLLQQQNHHIVTLNKEMESSNLVKTKLFSIISHDLRSPVSSLYAYLQLILQAKEMPSRQTTNAITRQTENLLETLEDLLMWSKSQLQQFKPEYSTVYHRHIVDEVLKLSERDIAAKNIQVNNFINETDCSITDGNMLTVILRNILSNAVQNAIVQSAISIYCEKSGSSVVLRIENSTSQKEQEILAKLNSEVVSSKKYGLGKILIQEFAEKLNGTVTYQYLHQQIYAVLTLPNSPVVNR